MDCFGNRYAERPVDGFGPVRQCLASYGPLPILEDENSRADRHQGAARYRPTVFPPITGPNGRNTAASSPRSKSWDAQCASLARSMPGTVTRFQLAAALGIGAEGATHSLVRAGGGRHACRGHPQHLAAHLHGRLPDGIAGLKLGRGYDPPRAGRIERGRVQVLPFEALGDMAQDPALDRDLEEAPGAAGQPVRIVLVP